MYRFFFLSIAAFSFWHSAAQDSLFQKGKLSFSGYLEAYYSYDLGNPDIQLRPDFFFNHNRHNEANVNLLYLKAAYTSPRIRGNLALMAGTYAQYNLSEEPPVLKNLFEANVGFRLLKKHNLWMDAGILPSHIGFESAVGVDCANLSRSILAENSPYYEAGVKLSYLSKNEKWYAAFMYLNGWQQMRRTPGNRIPAWGTQLTYTPDEKFSVNWSSYFGTQGADSLRRWRLFQNLYAKWTVHPKLNMTLGFDVGNQQTSKGSSDWSVWYAPAFIVQYLPLKKWRFALRGEGYSDTDEVIITTTSGKGFQVLGYSLNVDFIPYKKIMLRAEARSLYARHSVFVLNGGTSAQNFFFTGSASFAF
jgi:hypothetical protein